MDEATRAAYEAGPFAAVLRGAAEDRKHKAAEVAARPASDALRYIDDDVARDNTERAALAALIEHSPNRIEAERELEYIASRTLRNQWRGIDWAWLDFLNGPRMRQLPLPTPVGNGCIIEPLTRAFTLLPRTPRRKPRPRPLPGQMALFAIPA